jgi:hypothetical protein
LAACRPTPEEAPVTMTVGNSVLGVVMVGKCKAATFCRELPLG